jgi:hypothetical protein
VVTENYPNLKANQGFQDLRVQLEGTENRITVARNRYIKTVQDYNVLARSFPSNLTAMIFGYEVKPSFTVQNEAAISAPPAVSFRQAGPPHRPRPSDPPPSKRHERCCCAVLLVCGPCWVPRWRRRRTCPVPALAAA